MEDHLKHMEQLMQGFAALKRIPVLQYQYNPRDLVFQHKKIKLYHYQTKNEQANRIPLLIVFATVNRPEVLDLFPETSFIGGLLESGVNVYLLDWGYADAADQDLSMEDYLSYLDASVKYIAEKNEQKEIDLLGICQGGVFSLCYAALFQQRVKNLVLISTPVDFHTRTNLIAKLLRKINIDEFPGNVPGAWLTQFFISMRPFELTGKKYLRFIDNLSDQAVTEKFLRLEKWLYDAPDQAGTAFKAFIKDFYQMNKLIKGEITFHGRSVNLKNLNMPILNIMARNDEIVPMSASRPLKKHAGTKDYSQKIFASGHIGIYVSDKIGKRMPKAIAQWLKKRAKSSN